MNNPTLYRRDETDLKFTIAQAKIGGGGMTRISQVIRDWDYLCRPLSE